MSTSTIPISSTPPYDPIVGYGRSKTANILFAVEFDRRHKADGIRATAVHPGGIQTELGRHMTPELMQQMTARSGPCPASRSSPTRPSPRAPPPRSGRRRRAGRSGRRQILRRLPRGRIRRRIRCAHRRPRLCPRPRARQGAVGEDPRKWSASVSRNQAGHAVAGECASPGNGFGSARPSAVAPRHCYRIDSIDWHCRLISSILVTLRGRNPGARVAASGERIDRDEQSTPKKKEHRRRRVVNKR